MHRINSFEFDWLSDVLLSVKMPSDLESKGYGTLESTERSNLLPKNYDGRSNEVTMSQQLNDSMKSTRSKIEENSLAIRLAVNASWVVNWFLLIVKTIAVIISSSKAVTAALADSVVDLASQAILSIANYYIAKHSPKYPVGRSRLEALSVIGCAFIMSMASIEGENSLNTQSSSISYSLGSHSVFSS